MSGNLKNRMYAVWMCERAENKWTNVGEQQSMFKIVRLFVKFSRLRKISNSWSIVFFGLRNFSDLFGLRKFFMYYRTSKINGSSGLREFLSCQT